MAITAAKYIKNFPLTDTIQWYNDTGSAVVKNQLITITVGTNQGMVAIAQEAIASTATGIVAIKGVFQIPAAAIAFTAGQVVQFITSATSVTAGGTTTGAGLFAVGMAVEKVASSAGYVSVGINTGAKAFYLW